MVRYFNQHHLGRVTLTFGNSTQTVPQLAKLVRWLGNRSVAQVMHAEQALQCAAHVPPVDLPACFDASQMPGRCDLLYIYGSHSYGEALLVSGLCGAVEHASTATTPCSLRCCMECACVACCTPKMPSASLCVQDIENMQELANPDFHM